MAVIQNTLGLDIKPFAKAAKEAIGLSEDLAKPIVVDVQADGIKEVETAVEGIAGIKIDPFQKLTQQAKVAQAKVEDVEAALRSALASKDSTAIESLKKDLIQAKEEAQEFKKSIDEINGSLDEAPKKSPFADVFSKAKSGDVGALAGIGAAAGAAFPLVGALTGAMSAVGGKIADAVNMAKEFEHQLKTTSLQTGLTGEALESLGDQAIQSYRDGVGGSTSEALKILGTLKASLGDVVDTADIGDLATKATAVGKALNVEAPDLITKIGPLMKQFGKSYDEALQLVSAGSQNGIADVGGYLDAINEFTPSFKDAGFSAEQMALKFEKAGQAGVKDFGKVGDAIKEAQIRINTGDLAGSLASFGGEVASNLQGIVKLGQDGVLDTKAVLEQSIAEIEAQFKEGKIDAAVRQQLLGAFGGSIAEDLGADLYAKVLGADGGEKELAARMQKAGKLIQDSLPPLDIGKELDILQQQIGSAFIAIYDNIIAPILTPLKTAFDEIKKAFTDAFSGGGKSLGGLKAGFDAIIGVVQFLMNRLLFPMTTIFKLIAKVFGAVWDGIMSTIAAVQEQFKGFFGDAKEGGTTLAEVFAKIQSVMSTVGDVISTVLVIPFRIMIAIISKIVQAYVHFNLTIYKTIESIVKFVGSFQFVKDVIAKVSEFINKVIEDFQKFISVAEKIGQSLGLIAKPAKKAEEGIEGVGDASGDAIAKMQAVTNEVNELAASFNNALTQAQGQLTVLVSAGAVFGKYRAEIAAVAKAVRALEAAQDSANLAGDPNRQRAITEQRRLAIATTKKLEEDLNASLIVNTLDRERKLLDIQQKFDAQELANSIKMQEALIATSGVGVPEAKATLDALLQQQIQQRKQAEQDITLEIAKEQTKRLEIMQQVEGQTLTALDAINAQRIAALQRNVDAFSAQDVDALVKASVEAVERSTQAQIRTLVEATPQYKEAYDAINKQVELKQIDASEAQEQIKKLRQTIENELRGKAGLGDAIGEQLNAILATSEQQAVDTARNIRDAALDANTAFIRSDIIRAIEEQVRALEKQRDLLLLNTNLTADQRKEIEQGFANAIDKVRKGALTAMQQSVKSLGAALRDVQFDIDGDAAADEIDKVTEANDKLIESFERGEITYQEALAGMQTATASQVGFLNSLAENSKKALTAVAGSFSENLKTTTTLLGTIKDDIKKVDEDSTLNAEQKSAQRTALLEQETKAQERLIADVTISAGASFVDLLAQGESVGTALKSVVSSTVTALLAAYAPVIIGAFATIIPGPLGIAAGSIAVASLRALLASALSGFKEGGHTGVGGDNDVAGVVHKNEFVAPAWMTREHSAVLEHLYSHKTLESFPEIQKILHENQIVVQPIQVRAMEAQASVVNIELNAVTSELVNVRRQLEAMQSLHRTAQELTVYADPDTTIKKIERTRIRKLGL